MVVEAGRDAPALMVNPDEAAPLADNSCELTLFTQPRQIAGRPEVHVNRTLEAEISHKLPSVDEVFPYTPSHLFPDHGRGVDRKT